MRTITKFASLALAVFLAAGLAAQQDPVSKQAQAQRAFAALTERMQKLQVTLKATDPDKARILGIGTKYIQEKGIQEKMGAIKELLKEEEWDEALSQCRKVIKDLDKLIELLLKGDSRIEDLIKEIQRLEGFKDRVEDLIKDQAKEKDDAAKTEALEKHLKDIEKAKAKIQDLIQDQKDLRDKANQKSFSATPKDKVILGDESQDLQVGVASRC